MSSRESFPAKRRYNGYMALKPVTIRFDPGAYDLIAAEATQLGISISEYVQTAALSRAVVDYARRGGEPIERWEDLYETAGRVVHETVRPAIRN